MTPHETLAHNKNWASASTSSTSHRTMPVSVPGIGVHSQAELHLAAIKDAIEATDLETTPRVATRGPAAVLRWMTLADMSGLAIGFIAAWIAASLVNELFYDRALPALVSDGGARALRFGFIGLCVLMWFEQTGHYRMRMPFWQATKKVVSALLSAMVLDGFMQFTSKEDFSRLWLVGGWIVAIAGVVGMRGLARVTLRRLGLWQVPTLLVGSGELADQAKELLGSEKALGYTVCAQIDDMPVSIANNQKLWQNLCARFGASYVFIALDGKRLVAAGDAMHQLMREDVPFSILPPHRELPITGMVSQPFCSRDSALLTSSCRLEQPLPKFFKRMFDIVVSSGALLALLPLFATLAYLVKRDGGPMFYADRRVGINGRLFDCLKFRSMVVNSGAVLDKYLNDNPTIREEWNAYRKLRGYDPRVTKVGAFMRKLSLDELPQILNVLKGDMSLVGPRPIMTVEIPTYQDDIVDYHKVRPGITGLWQVCGRNEVTFARRVEFDSWYVRNWSLWNDIVILCRTVPVLLNKTGAY